MKLLILILFMMGILFSASAQSPKTVGKGHLPPGAPELSEEQIKVFLASLYGKAISGDDRSQYRYALQFYIGGYVTASFFLLRV